MTRVDPAFVTLACELVQDPARQFLGLIWSAYEKMRRANLNVDYRDLERSITQLLEPRVRDAMTGFEPFYVQHSPYERETMMPPPAQPPEYDLAFVFRADERIMWPMEAKVLEFSGRVAAYIRDIKKEFMTCRYAPFTSSGSMLGYLLTGNADDVFESVSQRLDVFLERIPSLPDKPNRLSRHKRIVPDGRPYPVDFVCYHLVLEFPNLRRSK